jgi:hypothetical protein
MKSWLIKYRISTALDSGKPMPARLQQRISTDAELQRFAYGTQALRRPPQITSPLDLPLHNSIMRAVRNSARQEQTQRAPILSWLAVSAAVTALAMICVRAAQAHPPLLEGPAQLGNLAQLVRHAVAGVVFP